jgi:Lon protease-like protein
MDNRTLHVLPQPHVLFPGATLPVRISGARQRKLIKEVIAGDRLIGVIATPALAFDEEFVPRPGMVGCLAKIVSARKLPHRQIRIVVRGVERFSILDATANGDSYFTAEVTGYSDLEESLALLSTFADEVRLYYSRLIGAATKVDSPKHEKPAALPADPSELSMLLPSLLRLDDESNQRFLASRSALMRLRELSAILAPAVSVAEHGVEVHSRSKANGHGTKRS